MPRHFLVLGFLLMGASTKVWAIEESYSNYESIVNDLKASARDKPQSTEAPEYDWEDVAIHTGLAMQGSWVSITAPNEAQGSALMKGLEFSFGMNLFSKKVRAEGAFTSFSQEELDPNLKAELKSFELRLIYSPSIQDGMQLRVGTGLAARYMNLEARTISGPWTEYQASTPASIFLLGVERKLSKTITLGPEASFRSAVVGETFDKSAWDASFRLNATF